MGKAKNSSRPEQREADAPRRRVRPAEEQSAELQMWRHAVEELRAQEFAGIEEALQALSEKVMERGMLKNAGDRDETRRFVQEMLAADPEILAVLEETLRIRRG